MPNSAYQVIRAFSAAELNTAVTAAIAAGKCPIGAPRVVGDYDDSGTLKTKVFYQAVADTTAAAGVTHYQVLSAESEGELKTLVDTALAASWKPLGTAMTVEFFTEGHVPTYDQFFQAMYKGVFLSGDASDGGGGNVSVADDGNALTAGVASINFTGGGVTASVVGDDVTVNIPTPDWALVDPLPGDGSKEILFNFDSEIAVDQDRLMWNSQSDRLDVGKKLNLIDATNDCAILLNNAIGWRDITGEITVRGSGANNPTWTTFRGGINAYEFSATAMKECWIVFHIPHDYAPGTDIHLHVHWSNAAATPNTGNVRWGFEYMFAKGHQQGEFPAPTTVYVVQASNAAQYHHHIAETDALGLSADLEVDGLLMVRVFRDAADGLDTCTDAVHLLTADVHYRTTNIGTIDKVPSFYAT